MFRVSMSLAWVLVLIASNAFAIEEHHLILIDASGSMRSLRGDDPYNPTRFAKAKSEALKVIQMSSPNTRYFAVWAFNGRGHTVVQDFGSAEAATNAINALTVGRGASPLVGSSCAAVDALRTFRGEVGGAKKQLTLVADGAENNTPVAHTCFGPGSEKTLYAQQSMDVGTWQQKFISKMRYGNSGTMSGPPLMPAVVISTSFLQSFNDITGSRVFGEGVGLGKTVSAQDSALASFFQGLAVETGGTFTLVEESSITGDANGDHCVDVEDYDLVINNYGMTVPPANPAADLNRDGIVNEVDYGMVIENWGAGSCS